MRTFHSLALLSFLTVSLTSPLAAAPGRPLSPLVLDTQLECTISAVVSDGDDFLVVCERFGFGAWGQIIADGRPAGPTFLISKGMGIGASAAWNGSSYVVSWCAEHSNSATLATTVSRNGSVGEPVKIHDRCPAALAANGDRVMFAVNTGAGEAQRDVVGGLLDENARPRSAPAVLFANHSGGHSLTATNAGFALGTFGYPRTSLTLFDRDGKPQGVPIPIDGPYVQDAGGYQAGRGLVASDGENVLMTFHASEFAKLSELRTAVVASDGTIQRLPATIAAATNPVAGTAINPMSIAWTGSDYLALLSLSTGFESTSPAWTRIAPDGERIGEITPLADKPGNFPTMASNGRENLVAYTDRVTVSTGVATPLYAFADPGTAAPRTPFRALGRVVAPHLEIAIGATPSQYLAAWTEEYEGAWRVRASRIDSNGRYLDGAGLILGTAGYYHSVAVDSDGSNWLVVWADGGSGASGYNGPVRAARISPTGVLLDPQPIELGIGNEASVCRGEEGWMVVATDRSSLVAIPVGRNGVAGERRTIHEPAQPPNERISYHDPVVAFDGTVFIAGASRERSLYYSEWSETHLAVTRIDSNGAPLDGPPALLGEPSPWSGLALVANGGTSMAFFSKLSASWEIPGKLFGVLLPSRTELEISNDADGPVAAAWDGQDFVVAWKKDTSAEISLARVTAAGVVSTPTATTFAADYRIGTLALAAVSGAPPLLGFVAEHHAWNGFARASAAFASEVKAADVPSKPVSRSATALSRDTIRVQWTPMADALGITIELRLPDGTYRPIGVAASSATGTDVPLEGLTGTAIRLRAWNSAGTSQASEDVAIKAARQRGVRK